MQVSRRSLIIRDEFHVLIDDGILDVEFFPIETVGLQGMYDDEMGHDCCAQHVRCLFIFCALF